VHNPLASEGAAQGAIEAQQLLPGAAAGASAISPQHLINSKLKPPLCAAACIERRALISRLDAAFRHKLVLLAAPIGSGKTTLLTQWYRRVAPTHAVAWLSLDERDNDPVRFFSYLIGAVHGAVPEFDAYIPIDPGAALFSESLDRVDQELTIVLDDFQWLTAPALIRMVDFLLYRSPDTVHWIISGRCMPEIGLSQLRLADQLLVVDAEDLNSDDGLIVQLSRKLCRRALSSEDAAGIKARTEGWVAGTKLALLAAAAGPAPAQTLQEFAGSHSEVARYLGASVLQEQSAEIREFLVASSVVDRMTGELCNALLGISHSQSLLERLERSQLFIQPLDSHGHWYRYHTLFLDFLRSVLRRDAARIPDLHERASRWFAEHQLYEEALHHAFLAGNAQWRLDLVARCLASWLQEGEVADVIHWSERLPRAEILTHSGISTAYIAALILCRRFDDATIALRDVESCVAAGRVVGTVHLPLLHAMHTILADSDCHVSIGVADSARLEGADSFLSATVLTLQAYALLRRN
jgi:LuxR family maltose regulon positive regulatory protein